MTRYLYHVTKPDRIINIAEKGEGLVTGAPSAGVVLPKDYDDTEDSDEYAEQELTKVEFEVRPDGTVMYYCQKKGCGDMMPAIDLPDALVHKAFHQTLSHSKAGKISMTYDSKEDLR